MVFLLVHRLLFVSYRELRIHFDCSSKKLNGKLIKKYSECLLDFSFFGFCLDFFRFLNFWIFLDFFWILLNFFQSF